MAVDQEDKQFLLEAIKEVLTPEQLKDILGPQAAPEPPAPEPIKMTIGGQEFSFKDTKEVEEKFNAFVAQASQLAAQPPAPAKPQASVTGDDAPSFDFNTYTELMTQGKITDGFRHAMMAVPEFRQTMEATRHMSAQLAAYQFKERHPELSSAPPQVGSVIEQVRQSLNLPFSADGLDAAYALATHRGMIPQTQTQTQQTQTQTQTQNPPPQAQNNPYLGANGQLAPPPTVSRSGDNSFGGYTEEALEAMTPAQLEALIRKLSPR